MDEVFEIVTIAIEQKYDITEYIYIIIHYGTP